MNLCTRDLNKAGEKAQELANMRGGAVAIFTTATDPNGPYWADSRPSWWPRDSEWVDMMVSTHGAHIFYPKTK